MHPLGAVSGALGLYIHVPFCSAICNYCDFNRGLLNSALKKRYVQALTKEIIRAGDGSRVDTICFGGGTPSLLDKSEVVCILDACRMSFLVSNDVEISLEMNPESCESDYIHSLLRAGINRVSLGVQSFNDHELIRLGRMHTAGQARKAFELVQNAGCPDTSFDLMLLLPGQSCADCLASIDAMLALGPDHASIYLLELYPNAPLREEMARSGLSIAPDDDAASMYLDALDRTDAAGYEHYEVSNVARPGHRSRHNLKYWRLGNWFGFGCGAHSNRAGVRWKNVSETLNYVERIEREESVAEGKRRLSNEEQLGDALFMGLRLVEGVDLAAVGVKHGTDIRKRFGAQMQPYLDTGVLVDEAGRWRLSRSGMLVSNDVMRAFV